MPNMPGHLSVDFELAIQAMVDAGLLVDDSIVNEVNQMKD